jgi:MoxR-like ATPase
MVEQNLSKKITAALSGRFIKSDDIARILSLALASKKNVLLWGPGGHGKSEMVQEALSSVTDFDNTVFVQSFGEGMDEARLFGGVDLAALDTEKVVRYFPQNSFLAKEYAVFEEIFDAPASVLLALKDTLTSKQMRNGGQKHPMKTKVIVALTNRDPQELVDIGPAAAALVERFPLQFKVEWGSYNASDYLELFRKVEARLPGANLNGQEKILAEVLAKASESDAVVSPRTAVHALGLVKASAELRSSDTVERQDLLDLRFLPGMEAFAVGLQKELNAAAERAAAEAQVIEAEKDLAVLVNEFNGLKSPIKLLQISKLFQQFNDRLSNMRVPDALTSRRKAMRDSCSAKAAEAQKRALEETRI